MVAPIITNPDFETEGAAPGQALGWTIASLVTPFQVAGFNNDEQGFEDYEVGWNDLLDGTFAWEQVTSDAAEFNGGADEAEPYERLWGPFEGGQAVFRTTAETFDLDDGDTLIVRVDNGAEQTATFNTGDFVDIDNATAAEVLAVILTDIAGVNGVVVNGRAVVRSDTVAGVSSLLVTGASTAAAKLGIGTQVVFLPEYEQKVDPNATHFENSAFFFVFPVGLSVAAQFDSAGTPENIEDYEELWGQNPDDPLVTWAEVLAGPGVTAASFDAGTPEDVEDYEEEWKSNGSFFFDWTDVEGGPGTTAATFEDGFASQADVEDYEEVIDANEVIEVNAPITNSVDYKIIANGEVFEYNPGGFDDENDVANELADDINNSTQDISAVAVGPQVRIKMNDPNLELSVGVDNPFADAMTRITLTLQAEFWLQPLVEF